MRRATFRTIFSISPAVPVTSSLCACFISIPSTSPFWASICPISMVASACWPPPRHSATSHTPIEQCHERVPSAHVTTPCPAARRPGRCLVGRVRHAAAAHADALSRRGGDFPGGRHRSQGDAHVAHPCRFGLASIVYRKLRYEQHSQRIIMGDVSLRSLQVESDVIRDNDRQQRQREDCMELHSGGDRAFG